MLFSQVKYYFFFVFLFISSVCFAQLPQPKQVDRYTIQSVQYSISDITPENWPCQVIAKSATEFSFDEEVFQITYESDLGPEVTFRLRNNKGESFTLSFKKRYNGLFEIEFGGYTFICSLMNTKSKKMNASEYSEQTTQNRRDRRTQRTFLDGIYN